MLRDILTYDPETGIFRWRVGRRNGVRAGDIAGRKHSKGYVVIMADGVDYLAHHLAWFFMTGEWPADLVDHRDTDKANNAWRNLRLADNSQNNCNAAKRQRNKSGFKGVRYVKSNAGFVAEIRFRGAYHYLGTFVSAELAHAAYCAAAARLHGEFARAA